MNIALPPELEAYVDRRARSSGYGSPEAVVCEAVRRLMEEEARHEEAVLAGLQETPSPLTADDLQSVRNLVKEARGRKAS